MPDLMLQVRFSALAVGQSPPKRHVVFIALNALKLMVGTARSSMVTQLACVRGDQWASDALRPYEHKNAINRPAIHVAKCWMSFPVVKPNSKIVESAKSERSKYERDFKQRDCASRGGGGWC